MFLRSLHDRGPRHSWPKPACHNWLWLYPPGTPTMHRWPSVGPLLHHLVPSFIHQGIPTTVWCGVTVFRQASRRRNQCRRNKKPDISNLFLRRLRLPWTHVLRQKLASAQCAMNVLWMPCCTPVDTCACALNVQ